MTVVGPSAHGQAMLFTTRVAAFCFSWPFLLGNGLISDNRGNNPEWWESAFTPSGRKRGHLGLLALCHTCVLGVCQAAALHYC